MAPLFLPSLYLHSLLPPSPRCLRRRRRRRRRRLRRRRRRRLSLSSAAQSRGCLFFASPTSFFPIIYSAAKFFFPLFHFRISSLHPAAHRDSTVATLCVPFVLSTTPFCSSLVHPLRCLSFSLCLCLRYCHRTTVTASLLLSLPLPLSACMYLFLLVPAMNPLSGWGVKRVEWRAAPLIALRRSLPFTVPPSTSGKSKIIVAVLNAITLTPWANNIHHREIIFFIRFFFRNEKKIIITVFSIKAFIDY